MSKSYSRRPLAALPLIALSVFMLGTKACQEDYDLASQSSVKNTPTPTSTPQEDATETPTPTSTETPTPTPTPEPSETTSALQLAAKGILNSLSELSARPTSPPSSSAGREPTSGVKESDSNPYAAVSGNWLGGAFARNVKDTDGDGFCDWLEETLGSDPRDPSSTPPPPRSKLSASLLADSDGDGQADNIEAAVGSDPRNPNSVGSVDLDGDSLPDTLEQRFGSDQNLIDSDRDGASDAVEFSLGIDPLNRDTDGDGILDGKEVELGSDPAIPESSVGTGAR